MSKDIPRLERALFSVAQFQLKYFIPIIIVSLGITALFALGLQNVRIQSDFTEILPQDLPVVVFENRITETFGATDTVFVLVRLERDCSSSSCVHDARDPRVMRMLVSIQDLLGEKTNIDRVLSPGSLFQTQSDVPETLSGVKLVLSQVPGFSGSYNRDYSATTVLINANVGSAQEEINRFSEDIENELANVEVPPGVFLTITGSPQLGAEIFNLLQIDAVNVTFIAGLIILILLVFLIRKPLRIFQTYTPILLSLIWTFGLFGWADIELSVATAAIGAFIIGLGIEYGIFFVKRYEEGLKEGNSVDESVVIAVSSIGSAITSSATTTMIGFLALTLTILPLIQTLGITLALSIFFSLVAALIVNPAFIILEERIIAKYRRDKDA